VSERFLRRVLLRSFLGRSPAPPHYLTIDLNDRDEDRLMLWALNALKAIDRSLTAGGM
jgi:hypothetical protein